MAKTIHEQQGLRIVQNEKNGFCVATLHFTADPKKRSPEWKAAARKGMSQAKYDQEFEISYDAFLGERVFPEIRERRSEIILREGPYEFNQWPKSLTMWAGFDYGTQNPSSMHVYTIVDGVTYAIWELYKPCKNILDFVEEMKACPFYNQLRWIAHDPDMNNRKQRDMASGATISVRTQFERLGITKWLSGSTDEQAWLSIMQRHWCGPEVTFKILESCPQLINELEGATYTSMTEKQLETQNYKEALVDKHNHAMDDLKYFMNANPSEVKRFVKIPSLVDTYGTRPIGAKLPPLRQKELGIAWHF